MRSAWRRFHSSPTRGAQFLRFASVGGTISIVDAGTLYLLPWLLGASWHLARAVSLTLAMALGYLLNRHFTFRGMARGGRTRWQVLRHFGVGSCGAALNYGVFSLTLKLASGVWGQWFAPAALPLFALWLGGIAGMTFNFVLSRHYVFRVTERMQHADARTRVTKAQSAADYHRRMPGTNSGR